MYERLFVSAAGCAAINRTVVIVIHYPNDIFDLKSRHQSPGRSVHNFIFADLKSVPHVALLGMFTYLTVYVCTWVLSKQISAPIAQWPSLRNVDLL